MAVDPLAAPIHRTPDGAVTEAARVLEPEGEGTAPGCAVSAPPWAEQIPTGAICKVVPSS